jgi:hypothetical protein
MARALNWQTADRAVRMARARKGRRADWTVGMARALGVKLVNINVVLQYAPIMDQLSLVLTAGQIYFIRDFQSTPGSVAAYEICKHNCSFAFFILYSFQQFCIKQKTPCKITARCVSDGELYV